MIDGALPPKLGLSRTRLELSRTGAIRLHSTLADKEAETNIDGAPPSAASAGGLVTATPAP
jgi:hypothetical protein